MRIKIAVTQAHITQGIRADCYRCPVALALVDAGFMAPWVDADAWRPDEALSRTRALPHAAMRFIHDFDEWQPGDPLPRPFTFVVNVADGHVPPRYLVRWSPE